MGNGGMNGLLKKEIPSPPGAPCAPGGEGISLQTFPRATFTHSSGYAFTMGSADFTPRSGVQVKSRPRRLIIKTVAHAVNIVRIRFILPAQRPVIPESCFKRAKPVETTSQESTELVHPLFERLCLSDASVLMA